MEESLNRHFKMVFEDFEQSTTYITKRFSLDLVFFLFFPNGTITWREMERLESKVVGVMIVDQHRASLL